MKRTKEINVKELDKGLFKIYDKKKKKRKYNYLFHEMENLGWIMDFEGTISSFDRMYKMEIIYIQPEKHPDDTSSNVITYEDVIKVLKENPDEVSNRFIESLERWKVNPN